MNAVWEEVPEAVVERAACVVYEAVRGLGLANGEVGLPTWQVAGADIRRGYRNGVRRVLTGEISRAGIDPGRAGGEFVHEAWRTEKTREGWQFAPEYNLEKRWHPSLRPWKELTEVQRFQYRLFLAVAGCFGTA